MIISTEFNKKNNQSAQNNSMNKQDTTSKKSSHQLQNSDVVDTAPNDRLKREVAELPVQKTIDISNKPTYKTRVHPTLTSKLLENTKPAVKVAEKLAPKAATADKKVVEKAKPVPKREAASKAEEQPVLKAVPTADEKVAAETSKPAAKSATGTMVSRSRLRRRRALRNNDSQRPKVEGKPVAKANSDQANHKVSEKVKPVEKRDPATKAGKPKAVATTVDSKVAEKAKLASKSKPAPKADGKPVAKAAFKEKPKSTSKVDVKPLQKKPKRRFKWLGKLFHILLFVGLVIVPWVGVIDYITNTARSRYITTSDVVVKQVGEANVSAGTGITALLGSNSTSVEDARYLKEFILSNDMIKRLDKIFNFREAYYLDGSDFIYELPKNATQEELLEYFKKIVKIELNEQTNVLSLTTEAFNPEYALELNKAILIESEKFVNNISQKIATDQLQDSQGQLADAKERLNASKQKLLSYQNETKTVDAKVNVESVNQLIGGLQAQLASLKTEERQLLSYLNPDAPQVVSMRSQISAVEVQIQQEKEKLTSNSAESAKLNAQAIQFETIKADIEFATEMYKISLSSYEKARLEAYRKMKNLIIIAAPYKAEEALYPRVQYIIWTSLVFLLIFYGFVRLIISVVKDHAS